MQQIPETISDFPEIRRENLLYVDKTGYLHKLISRPGQKYCFFSRPRRFGKSLMLSTLKAIFQGQKELFENLDICKTSYDWKVHPVIHLNMGFCASANYKQFAQNLPGEIARGLGEAGYAYQPHLSFSQNFGKAIDDLYEKNNAPVVLIDEYDDPVARTLKDVRTAEKVRDDLAEIYGQLKDRSGKVRFLMITGVSKFTKMSIFSALSNMKDVSFDDDYATMLGFTEEELETYYGEYMAAHAQKMELTLDAYRAELRRMYNGYRFASFNQTTVYNPVSIHSALADCKPLFTSGWADTGRPSMLMNFLKREEILAFDPEKDTEVDSSDFDITNLEQIPIKGLLYQTGYLTIKEYDPQLNTYSLTFPDEEIRRDFSQLMASLIGKNSVVWASSVGRALLKGNWEAFFTGLKALYAGVAYGPTEKRICEYSYGRCLAFLLQGQGILCHSEVTHADGRADMVCTHPLGIFIFEFKVDHPAAVAINQIQQKRYAAPYAADKRPIWLIGLSFDSSTRQLVDTRAERYASPK